MKCNLLDESFKNGKNSVLAANGQTSLLFGQLYDIYNEDGQKAYNIYLITQQENFNKWFAASETGNNVDENGEPKIFKNFYVSIDPETKQSKRWYIFDSNIESATAMYPVGLTRIPGMTPAEIKEAVDVLSAAFVKNKRYQVQDFDDVKNLDYRFFGEWAAVHMMQLRKNPKLKGTKTYRLYQQIFEDIVYLRKDVQDRDGNRLPLLDENDMPVPRYNPKDPVNSSQLLEMVFSRMQRETRIELKEDEKTSALNVKEAHFSNPKEKLTANVKLMIRSLFKVTFKEGKIVPVTSKILGKPTLVDLTKTYATIMQYLSNIYSSDPTVDVYTLMIDKLKDVQGFHPEFNELVAMLERSPQYKKTQFVQAFMRPELDYTSTFVDGTSKVGTRIGSPDVQSSEKNIRDNWQIAYEQLMTKPNQTGKRILDVRNAERAVKAYKEFNAKLKQVYKRALVSAKKQSLQDLTEADIDLSLIAKVFAQMLNTIGVQADSTALEYLFKQGKNPAIEANSLMSDLKYIFLGSTKKGSLGLQNLIDNHNKTKEGRSFPLLEDVEGNINSVMFDEKAIKPFSTAQGIYDADLLETTVLGPGATLYWKYGMYSYLHTAVLRIQKGDKSYVEQLKKLPYTETSVWVNWLLENEDNAFAIKQFLHMVNTSTKSEGKKNTYLTGADALINNMTRILNGQYTTVSTGTSSTQHYLQGPENLDSGVEYLNGDITFSNNKVVFTFQNYIKADIESQRQAWDHVFGKNKLPEDQLLLNYHYKLDKEGVKQFIDPKTKLPTGNVFKGDTMMFPDLAYGKPIAKKLKLYHTTASDTEYTRNLPMHLTDEILNSEEIKSMIKTAFISEFKKSLELAKKYDVYFENKEGVLYSKAIDATLINSFKTRRGKDNNTLKSQISARAFGDYVFNSIISARESMGMFVGHPAMYKSIEDVPKRSGHFTTPTQRFRIYEHKGKWAINPKYYHATVDDIMSPGEFFTDPKWKKALGKSISDMFEEVDLTDGTTWITPELFKQRERGLGRWPDSKEKAFERIMRGKAKKDDYKKVNFTPQKFTVRGTQVSGQYNVPRIEKTAYVVLWPDLVETTPLKNLYDKMVAFEKENSTDKGVIGVQVAVISAVKAGAKSITKIDTNGVINDNFELDFSLENHEMMGLAQELPSKGFTSTIVGSQPKQIILSNIDLDAAYPGYTSGAELLKDYYTNESIIANKGKEKFAQAHGINPSFLNPGVNDPAKLHAKLMERYLDTEDDNMIKGLEDGTIPLDAMFQDRRGLQSALTNGLSRKSILYKALGGQFVQIAGFGLGQDSARYSELKKSEKNRIRWMIDAKNLKAPQLDLENKKIIPGQILLPYEFIEKIKPKDGRSVEQLSDTELKQLVDKDALRLLGYRIPNQSIASIFSMEIAGVLPKGSGDSIVVFDGMTTLTGCDFDIDKIFLLVPHLEFIDGKLRRVELDSSDSMEAFENERIRIWESILQNAEKSNELLFPTDTGFLKDDANDVYNMAFEGSDEKIMTNLKFFGPVYQDSLKTRFLMGKKMVGSVANNIVDHIPSSLAGLQLTEYIGYGHKGMGKDAAVYTDLSRNDVIGSDMLITQIISAYMNANVDIEKDPYISYVNFNTHTVNVAFLLLRSGVNYKWVNRFLAQPVIREYVDNLFSLDSEALSDVQLTKSAIQKKAVNKTKKDFFPKTRKVEEVVEESEIEIDEIAALDEEVLEAEEEEVVVEEDNIAQELTVPVLEDLLRFGDTNENYFEMQKFILDEFLRLNEHGDSVLEQMLGSRLISTGLGRNLTEVRMRKEKKESLEKDPRFINFGSKYQNNTADGLTLMGVAHQYIDYILETFEDTFLSESEFMVEGLHKLLDVTLMSDNILNRQKLVDTMYTYLYSGFQIASTEEFGMQNLLFSKSQADSFVVEFREMQKSNPDSILLNKLLTSKINSFGQNELPSYVKSRGLKGVPSEIKNLAVQEWEDLYIDPKTRKFAIKLVNMAFFVSGFNNNMNSFHTYIPMTWVKNSGFSDYVKHNLEDLSLLSIDDMVDQILRHNTENPRMVTDLGTKPKKVQKGIKNSGFKDSKNKYVPFKRELSITLTGKAREAVKRKKANGKTIYAPIIKSNVLGELTTQIMGYRADGTPIYTKTRAVRSLTYKLIGLQYTTVNGKPSKNPVYEVISPLGFKDSKGNTINEYRYDPEGYTEKQTNYSIFEQNDPKIELKQFQLASYREFRQSLKELVVKVDKKPTNNNPERDIC